MSAEHEHDCERCDERSCAEHERDERSFFERKREVDELLSRVNEIPPSVRTVRAMRNRRRVIE